MFLQDVVTHVQNLSMAVFMGVVLGGTVLVTVLFRRLGGAEGARQARQRGDYTLDGLLLYLLVMVVYVGAGGLLQYLHEMWGMIIAQILLLLVPAIAAPALLGLNSKKTLSVGPSQGLWFVGALAFGLSAWLPLGAFMAIQELVFPLPPGFEEAFAEQVLPESPDEWVATVLAFALLPAICEESLFRGALLGFFKGKMGWVKAVVLTSVLFGLLHLTPYRIFPTGLLGLALGCLTVMSGSIFPAMVLHFVHNSTLLTVGMIFDSTAQEEPPVWFVLSGVLALSIACTAWYFAYQKQVGKAATTQ